VNDSYNAEAYKDSRESWRVNTKTRSTQKHTVFRKILTIAAVPQWEKFR